MKKALYIFLYLYIYATFSWCLISQTLHLSIETKDNISAELIDSLNITTKFSNYLSLKKETDSLHYKFQSIGFIENELISLQKTSDSSYNATYFFGERYKSILIYYSKEDFSKKELLQISNKVTDTYFILFFENIEISLQKLISLKTSGGNSFARVSLENFSKTKNNIQAFIKITNGTKRTIDHIVVKGYEKFPKSFIKYYAGIKKGIVFDKQKIIDKSNALNSLGFVTNLKAPEILFKKDSTTVYLYLKKQKNNLFDGILGFSSDENNNKLVFNGYLNLELNNNLNYGEQFLLNYKADGNDQQNFRVKIKMPYLLKSPLGVELELKIFKRDSTFTTTDQQAKISYQITPASSSYIGYKSYESSNLRNEDLESLEVEDYESKFFLAGLSYLKLQNNALFPKKYKAILETEIGSRDSKDKKESQIRVSATLHYIFNLNYKNSIFLQSSTNILTSDSYLTNELYRFGGINSIRGFNENSIDASFYSILNTEYRFQINQGIYVHSIIDVAYFENQIILLKQKLYSFGIGVGLETRAGILKFSIANGNAENQDFNFSNTKIHISISSRF
ncbi:MAG: hypothetical protein L3J09_11845 [Flavobacteriaceae bacterium]|nr:hypothetical protein [Flavobacteriaceae bacterium]